MKILAINGSHRGEQGLTGYLIRLLTEGVHSKEGQFDTVNLSEMKLYRCTGCQTCQKDKSLLKCIYDDKDDMKQIFEKMREADIIIFATPIYIMNMTGLLKTFIDRFISVCDCSELKITRNGLLFHHIDHAIFSKPMALLACCDNMEKDTAKSTVSYFKTYSRFMGAPLAGALVRRMGKMMWKDGRLINTDTFPAIRQICDAYRHAGQELASTGRISRKTARNANKNIPGFPAFDILMKFRPFKKAVLEKAVAGLG